ncbi:hypothetical protein Leryth_004893 [Lithospermum erythrorhizon]|nr:hypothetical protein Leryth_004893 [Lithospermum erythrorhizon]
MEKTLSDTHATETLKFKTLVLKVLIHCEGCRKTVTKVIKSTEGVYKTEVDLLQHKVAVTGNFDANLVIKKLRKKGKQAEILHEATTTTPKFDDMKYANREEGRPASSSVKSKENDENKQENPPIIKAHKNIPAEKMVENKKPSQQTNPADKMPSGNKIHLIGEKLRAQTSTDLGGGGGGNNSSKTRMKPNKTAENGEGHINNAPPALMMPVHFPPNSNVVANAKYKEVMNSNTSLYPSSNGDSAFHVPGHFPPDSNVVAPAKHKELMSSNTSSYPRSNGSSAFHAPPAQQHSYAYSGPSANGYYPPPSPDSVSPFSTDHNDDYYDDDDDKIGCSIM